MLKTIEKAKKNGIRRRKKEEKENDEMKMEIDVDAYVKHFDLIRFLHRRLFLMVSKQATIELKNLTYMI